MAETEHFSLRWNNFHNNLSEGFHSLLEEVDLVDVTLAAEAHYLQAHKIILSVCSPYFRQLFKANPCKHPIVILKDVCYKDLEALLQFMYQGEVNVCQEELASFLKTAEMLQIKGLAGSDSKLNESTVSLAEPPSQIPKPLAETVENCESNISDSSSLPCKRLRTDSSPERKSALALPVHLPALSTCHPLPEVPCPFKPALSTCHPLPEVPCPFKPALGLPQESKIEYVVPVLPNTKQEPEDDVAEVEDDETSTNLLQLLHGDEVRQSPGSEPSLPDVPPGPSRVFGAGPGLLPDNGSSQDGIQGAPASECKVMQTMHHELYLSASRGRCNGRVRKRCVHCYDINRRILGCRLANQKTLKVSTFCGTCPKFPFMCVNCFKIHIIVKKDLGEVNQ